MAAQLRLDDRMFTDKNHTLLRERIHGREADLLDTKLRAALVTQLSNETQIHAAFIEGFLEGFDDSRAPSSFENRETQKLPTVE